VVAAAVILAVETQLELAQTAAATVV